MKNAIEKSMEKWSVPKEEFSLKWLHGHRTLPKLSQKPKQYVYFHGFWSCGDHFMAIKLAKLQFDIGNVFYRFSFRWNGKSDLDFSTITLSTQAEDIKNMVDYILDNSNLDTIIPVCYSMWASSLLAAIQKYPEIEKYFEKYFFFAPSFDFLENRKKKMWDGRMQEWKENWYVEVKNDARGIIEKLPYFFVEDAEEYDLKKAFESLKKPMTIVHGNEDDFVPIEATRDFISLWKWEIDFHEVNDGHKLVKGYRKVKEVVLGGEN